MMQSMIQPFLDQGRQSRNEDPYDWDEVAIVHEDFEQPIECPLADDPQFVICQYPFTALEAIERIEAAGDGKVTRRARLDAGLDNP